MLMGSVLALRSDEGRGSLAADFDLFLIHFSFNQHDIVPFSAVLFFPTVAQKRQTGPTDLLLFFLFLGVSTVLFLHAMADFIKSPNVLGPLCQIWGSLQPRGCNLQIRRRLRSEVSKPASPLQRNLRENGATSCRQDKHPSPFVDETEESHFDKVPPPPRLETLDVGNYSV